MHRSENTNYYMYVYITHTYEQMQAERGGKTLLSMYTKG